MSQEIVMVTIDKSLELKTPGNARSRITDWPVASLGFDLNW